MTTVRVEQDGDDVRIWVKAVPGAARDEIVGALGDRLKVRVSAAPEGGKANRAICRVIARRLDVKGARVIVEAGQTSREKVVRVEGIRSADVCAALESR